MVKSLGHMGLVGILLVTTGCATSSVVSDRPAVVRQVAADCGVFVAWPTSARTAFQGNVGVNGSDVEALVANRILKIVRDRCPHGDIVRPTPAPVAAIPGYAAALGGTGTTPFELQAAASALERGAHYLLVPKIEQWNQTRTDDPIGALSTPRNRIAISLRLMCLDHPAVAGRVNFSNRSRLTLNQAASRLLNADFDAAVRALLVTQRPAEL